MREQAKIEYLGEFVGGAAAPDTKVKTEARTQPKSEEAAGERPQK